MRKLSPIKKNRKPRKHKLTLNVSFVLLGFFVISIFGFGYFFYLAGSPQDKPVDNSIVKRGHVMNRTRRPGVVYQVAMTSNINPNNGKPYNNKSLFSVSDTVYANIGLKNVQKGTHIEYVRYYNGKYLDHGSVEISNKNARYISFKWERIDTMPEEATGPYLLKIYTNGRLETTVHYSIS